MRTAEPEDRGRGRYARTQQHAPTLGAIVYLAQTRHNSYARDSMALLRQSVKLLHTHYNARQRDDVLFLHAPDGNVSEQHQQQLVAMCRPAVARFVDLPRWYWELPPGASKPIMPESIRKGSRSARRKWASSQRVWQQPRFSVGYRHMIRLFTLGLWDLVASMGYKYLMRMDEDSLLWSPIRYNLFEFMEARGLDYGYRLASWESGNPQLSGGKFHDFVRDYVLRNRLKERVARSGMLLAPCLGLNRSDARLDAEDYTLERCGNINGPYNNWFVSSVAFWKRADVQHFLRHVNDSQLIYYERYNDILWHGAAVQIFLPPERVHLFQDFAYEHITTKVGLVGNGTVPETCIGYGGLALGNVTGADAHAALARLLQLKAALSLQAQKAHRSRDFYRFCTRERPCWLTEPRNATGSRDAPRTDAALLLGSVSIEQPTCHRRPRPYHCGLVERNGGAAFVRAIELDRWRHEGPNHASHVAERWNESLFSVPSASSSKESKGTLLVRLRDRELLRRNLKCDRSLGGGGPAVMRFLMGGRPKGEAELARMVMEQPDAKHGLNGAALRLGRGILT